MEHLTVSFSFNNYFIKLKFKEVVTDAKLFMSLIMLAIPFSALLNFAGIKSFYTTLGFENLDNNSQIRQISIVKGDNFEPISPFLWPVIQEEFELEVFSERQKQLKVRVNNKTEAKSATFVNTAVTRLNLATHLGNLKGFDSLAENDELIVALSHHFWHEVLNRSINIGQNIVINEVPVKVVAILEPSFNSFRKINSQDFILPMRQIEQITGYSEHHPSPDLYTYGIYEQYDESQLASKITGFLINQAYIFSPSAIHLSKAIGTRVNDYNKVQNRLQLLNLLFIILLAFSFIAFVAVLSNRFAQNKELFDVAKLCGSSRKHEYLIRKLDTVMILLVSLPILLSSYYLVSLTINLILENELHLTNSHGWLFNNSKDFIYWVFGIIIVSEFSSTLQSKFAQSYIGRGTTVSNYVKFQAYFLIAVMISISSCTILFTIQAHVNLKQTEVKNLGFNAANLFIISRPIPDIRSNVFHSNSDDDLLIDHLSNKDTFVTFSMSPPFSKVTSFATWFDSENVNLGATSGSRINSEQVSPNYFDVIGTKFIRGKAFSKESPFSIVVNETLWNKHFSDSKLDSAVLKMPLNSSGKLQPFKVVGVVEDIYKNGPDFTPLMTVYSPITSLTGFESFVIRTNMPPKTTKEKANEALQLIKSNPEDLDIKSVTTLLNKSKAPSQALFNLSAIILIVVLVSTFLISISLINQLIRLSAREIALKSAIGFSSQRLFYIEFLIITISTVICSCISIIVFSSYRDMLSKYIGDSIFFNAYTLVLATSALLAALSVYLYTAIKNKEKLSWHYLT